MGQTFGYIPESGFKLKLYPEVTPGPFEEPTFDPLLGFPNGRKPREMKATEAELQSAKVPLKERGYCSHLLLDFLGCRKANFPWVVKCHHEKHAYLDCKYDDFIIRAKEYERERRLRVKAEKCRKQKAKESLEES